MATTRIHNGLNKKEQKVLAQFVKAGRPHAMSLADLAEACWGYKPAAQANSWVRNSIRRPVYLGLLEPTGPKGTGQYKLTPLGREMAKKGLDMVCEKAEDAPAKAKVAKAKVAKVAEPKLTEAVQAAIAAAVASVNAPAIVPEVVKPEVVVEAKLVEGQKIEICPGLTVVEVVEAPAPAPEATTATPWVQPA